MIYKFITNNPELARYAVSCGVQRIFVDMEYLGKEERQGHIDSHKARHTLTDLGNVRKAVPDAELMVRINPVHERTPAEVADVLKAGVDVVMLPMFTSAEEVAKAGALISGSARFSLLLETPQALTRLDEILELHDMIDEVHVGLNDLHLGLGLDFMFEVLSGGLVDVIAAKVQKAGIRFGFGGVARAGEGAVPAELVLGEHVRLGSEMVILSRTFHQNARSVEELKSKIDLGKEIEKLDACLNGFKNGDKSLLEDNRQNLIAAVRSVVREKAIA